MTAPTFRVWAVNEDGTHSVLDAYMGNPCEDYRAACGSARIQGPGTWVELHGRVVFGTKGGAS